MLDRTATQFSHIRPADTPWRGEGLRDFFLYRDLGVAEATQGKLLVQLVKANDAPEVATGWHRHEANFHVVVMLKGWARFMYETWLRPLRRVQRSTVERAALSACARHD